MSKAFTVLVPDGHRHAVVVDAKLFISSSFIENSTVELNVRALIDTGANSSCVSSRIASACALCVEKYATLISMQGRTAVPMYKMDVVLGGGIRFNGVSALEFPGGSDFDAIIGMDVLTHGEFALSSDGSNLYFSMRVPPSGNVIDFVEGGRPACGNRITPRQK